jgi:hypothetical protein
MTPPLSVRPLTAEARHHLETPLRSSEAFALRRCPIVLASARGQRRTQIARNLGCATQSVCNDFHAFHGRGTCGGEGTVPPSTTDSPRAGCRQVRATSSSVTRMSAHLAATRRAFPVRQACAWAKSAPRQPTVRPQVRREAIRAARHRQETRRSQPSMRRERGRRHARAGHPPPWPAPASRCRAGENASLAGHHRGALNVVRLGAWWLDTPRPKRAARPSPLCGGPLPKVTSQLHSLSMSVLRRRAWARAVARRRTPSRMAGIGTDAYPSSSARCSDGSI